MSKLGLQQQQQQQRQQQVQQQTKQLAQGNDNDHYENEEEQGYLTLWQTMFPHGTQQTLSGEETAVTREDAIEKHRKKKEALYEREKQRVLAPKQSVDSRLDTEESRGKESKTSKGSKGGGLWARLRRGRSGEKVQENPTKSPSFEFVQETTGRDEAADHWSSTESVTKIINDSSQRSATYRQFGGDPLHHIHVEESKKIPVPSSPYHVVVKITASTVTVQDCLIRRGLDFNLTQPVGLPAVSGRDFVGFVLLCGSKVNKLKPGDRVAGLLRSGGNARYTDINQDFLVPVPKQLDGAEAACMVSVYTAAYQAINLATKDSSVYDLEGKQVLVVGGMDGIGQAIIQMCRKAKATVFATAPDRRHAYVRSILNATPLPDKKEEWAVVAKDSMDVVFDGIADGNMEASFAALNDTGKLVCFGHSSLLRENMGWFGVPFEKRLQRFQLETRPDAYFHDIWDSFQQDPALYKKNLTALFQLLQMKKVKPQIAKRVALDEVALSHRKLEQGQVRGTVVCLPWKRVSRRNVQRLDADGMPIPPKSKDKAKEKPKDKDKAKTAKN